MRVWEILAVPFSKACLNLSIWIRPRTRLLTTAKAKLPLPCSVVLKHLPYKVQIQGHTVGHVPHTDIGSSLQGIFRRARTSSLPPEKRVVDVHSSERRMYGMQHCRLCRVLIGQCFEIVGTQRYPFSSRGGHSETHSRISHASRDGCRVFCGSRGQAVEECGLAQYGAEVVCERFGSAEDKSGFDWWAGSR